MPKRSEEDWIRVYEEKRALWIHDGNPLRPHTRNTWGEHTAGYVNSSLVFEDELMLWDAAFELLQLFIEYGGEREMVERIVGPHTWGAQLAGMMAQISGNSCIPLSPKKSDEGRERVMVFTPEEFSLLAGKSVLLCDDVLTTSSTLELVARAVRKASGIVLPFVAVGVNRSGQPRVGGKRVVALINRYLPMWLPEDCPLCKKGSKVLNTPKDPANWALLNAEYPEKESL